MTGEQSAAADGAPLALEIRGVSKRFPGVHALDRVDLDVRRGEVHVLLGENGAGKSTLMKILSGVYARDEGRIFIDGQEVEPRNPRHAQTLGISIIYQTFSQAPAPERRRESVPGTRAAHPLGHHRRASNPRDEP